MNRLHITWSQLQAEPAEEYLIFRAFINGEAEAMKTKADMSAGAGPK